MFGNQRAKETLHLTFVVVLKVQQVGYEKMQIGRGLMHLQQLKHQGLVVQAIMDDDIEPQPKD